MVGVCFVLCCLLEPSFVYLKDRILTRAPHAEANACLLSLNAVKGHDFVKKPYRVMSHCQIAALVMVNAH